MVTLETFETLNASLYKEAADLAYPLALESYKEAERRLDVVERRLQELLAFAVTATLGIIAVTAGKVAVDIWPFSAAMAACMIGIGIGVYARLRGRLKLLSMGRLYDNFMSYTDTEFKVALLSWAADHNAENARAIQTKATLTSVAAICFLAEAILLGCWGLTGRGPVVGPPDQSRSGAAAAGVPHAAAGKPEAKNPVAPKAR